MVTRRGVIQESGAVGLAGGLAAPQAWAAPPASAYEQNRSLDAGLFRVPGTLRRICQLTGRVDPEGLPMANDTESVGITGVDLGVPVEHQGRLWFLFGDVPPDGSAGDPLAFTTDTRVDRLGPQLQFVRSRSGGFRGLTVPGLALPGQNPTPTGGYSANGRLYAFVILNDHLGDRPRVRSFLASTDDPLSGRDFVLHALVSDSLLGGRFFQIGSVVLSAGDSAQLGLPATPGLLLHGQGLDRAVSLAWMPLAAMADGGTANTAPAAPLLYLTAIGWVARTRGPHDVDPAEMTARVIVRMPSISQLQVVRLPEFGQWLMVYGTAAPRGFNRRLPMVYRTARDPRGPWSEEALLLDPDAGAYGRYLLDPDDESLPEELPLSRGRGGGWCYAPYLLSRYTTVNAARGEIAASFIASVNAPHQVMVFRTILRRDRGWRGWMRVLNAEDVALADEHRYATVNPETPPCAVALDERTLHVLANGSDGRIWRTARTPGAPWGDFTSWLPVTDNPRDPRVSTFSTATPPVAVLRGSTVDVFAMGNDARIWHRPLDGGQWFPVSDDLRDPRVSTFSTSTPPVAVGRGSTVDLFAMGNDARVWHRDLNGGRWLPVSDDPDDPRVSTFSTSTPPVAVARGSTVDLFAMGNDARVWHRDLNGGRWLPVSDDPDDPRVSTFSTSTPPVAVARSSTVDLFAIGTDARVWHRTLDDGQWCPVSDDPDDPRVSTFSTTTPPAAVVRGSTVDLFALGTDARVWHRALDAGPWLPITDDPANPRVSTFSMATPPVVVVRGAGLDVFAIGNDARVWRTCGRAGG